MYVIVSEFDWTEIATFILFLNTTFVAFKYNNAFK